MKIFLDDTKSAPQGWVRCYSVNEILTLLECIDVNQVEEISLDYDLGKYTQDGGQGVKVVAWMVENNKWPKKIRIHDTNRKNAEGIETMKKLIREFGAKQKVN